MSERKMPNSWFTAHALGRPIIAIMNGERYRAPGEGERQLGPFVLPPFQRPPVWTRKQQVQLLESIWSGLPIGAYVYNVAGLNHPCDGWLLDGQQRVTAILAYVADEFPVFGWRFSELTLSERRGFQMKPIAALETKLVSKWKCQEVYERLAYGGTAHAQ